MKIIAICVAGLFVVCCHTMQEKKIEIEIGNAWVEYEDIKIDVSLQPESKQILVRFWQDAIRKWEENKVEKHYDIHNYHLWSAYVIGENKPESAIVASAVVLLPVSFIAGGQLTSAGKVIRTAGLILSGGLVIYEVWGFNRHITCQGHLVKKEIIEQKIKSQRMVPLMVADLPVEIEIHNQKHRFVTDKYGIVRIDYKDTQHKEVELTITYFFQQNPYQQKIKVKIN